MLVIPVDSTLLFLWTAPCVFRLLRYSCGQHLMFLDCSAVFSECRFSIPAPESHRSVAKLRRHKLRITCFRVGTKSSFAPLLLLSPKSHTTFWGPHCSSLSHIPFGRSFSFQFAPQLVVSEKGRKLTPSIINWELFYRLHEEIL